MTRLVTLIDGSQVDSSSEEWRQECEARYLLSLPLYQRRRMLHGYTEDNGRRHRGIAGIRGPDEVERIQQRMKKLWAHTHATRLRAMNDNDRAQAIEKIEVDAGPAFAAAVRAALSAKAV